MDAQEEKPRTEEISVKLKGIDDTKEKVLETERNIYISIENNQIKFRIEHENILKIYEDKFKLEDLKYNIYFHNFNSL